MILRFLTNQFGFSFKGERFIFQLKGGEGIIFQKGERPIIISKKVFAEFFKKKIPGRKILSRQFYTTMGEITTNLGEKIQLKTDEVAFGSNKIPIKYYFAPVVKKKEFKTGIQEAREILKIPSYEERVKKGIGKQKRGLETSLKLIEDEIELSENHTPRLGNLFELRKKLKRKLQSCTKLLESKFEETIGPQRKKILLKDFPKEGRTSQGSKILIGGNQKQNANLFRKYSSTQNLFFHSGMGLPGSTVILLSPNPSEEEILETAQLAAVFSKAWGVFRKIPVSYAPCKQVRDLGVAQYSLKKSNEVFVNVFCYISIFEGEPKFTSKRFSKSFFLNPGDGILERDSRTKGIDPNLLKFCVEKGPKRIDLKLFFDPGGEIS